MGFIVSFVKIIVECIMDEKLIHICCSSLQLFLENGVKNTSMDDISKYLKMSKKTLYQYVDNKEDLLVKVLNVIREKHKDAENESFKENRNAIEVLFHASQKIYEFQIKLKNSFRFDLEKYYPCLWNDFQLMMRDKSHLYFKENLLQGIEEGLYRKDIDIDLVSILYMAKIDGVHTDFARNSEKFTYRQLFEALFEHQIRAIATREGLEFLENRLKDMKFSV